MASMHSVDQLLLLRAVKLAPLRLKLASLWRLETPSFTFAFIVVALPFIVQGLIWVCHLLYRKYQSNSVPGPWLGKFSRLWLVKTLATGDSARMFADVNREYGPLVRVSPNQVMTDDPDTISRMLATNSKYLRAHWFESLRVTPEIASIISERDLQKHKVLRYKLSPGFSGRGIDSIEGTVDKYMKIWVNHIASNWTSEPGVTKPFNVGAQIEYLTVDIISQMCLGRDFGYIEADRDILGFMHAVEVGMIANLQFSVLHELQALYRLLTRVPGLRRVLVPHREDKSGLGRMMGVINEAMDKRQSRPETTSKGAMMDFLFRQGFSYEEVGEELLLALVAGSETTATAIQATLLAIILDRHVYNKLQAEIDAAINSGTASSPVKDTEARSMPYLQACVLEGLRRFPPVGQLREREVPAGGDIVNGYFLPAGTRVGINGWGTQMNAVFGPDPEQFRPERWLEASPERLTGMRRTQELIFGHGGTKCLGMNLALMELNKVVFEVSQPPCPSVDRTGKL